MTAMEGYLRLGAAIVEQACRDALSSPMEVKRFFCDSHSIFDIEYGNNTRIKEKILR